MEKSSGILVYRFKQGELQVLLGKCGGPAWAKLNKGAWNIPKGHIEDDENKLETAKREFYEETNLILPEDEIKDIDYLYLGESITKSRKHVYIYAIQYDFTAPYQEDSVIIHSNLCETEWPRKSGNIILVPELSEAKYFNINKAKEYIFSYQRIFLDRLIEQLVMENKS